MKSRSSSPQTSPQVVVGRRYRVESSSSPASPARAAGANAGGPRSPSLRKSSLRIEELPKITMNSFHPFNTSPSPNTSTPVSPGLLTAIPNGTSTQRRPSAENAPNGTPTPHRTDSLAPASPNGVSPSTTGDASPAGWSSAIGHATTSGKSGRVIERLMSENDKLKRDLSTQVARCQDLEKSLQTYKPQIEALRAENDNLSHSRNMDSSLLARRDRKIEELKAELTAERERRGIAERVAREREERMETAEEERRREVGRLVEETRHATLHAEILETSHRQLSAEYKARAEKWRHDLQGVEEGREEDRRRMERLDVVAEQMRTEVERNRKTNTEIVEAWEKLRSANEEKMHGMLEEGEQENERVRQLSGEMDRVVKEMRWVMGVQNVREESRTKDAENE